MPKTPADSVAPDKDLPKQSATGDQTLTIDERQFYGLYFGTILPSGLSVITDSRCMPKSARVLWRTIVQIEERNGKNEGLYNLVKFGGAPLAEDVNDGVVIHDDPRKGSHKPSMYDEYIKLILRLKVSIPFHTYTIDDYAVRRFLYFVRVPVSKDSRSNNSISSHKDGYTIDGDKVNIIMASTGSGKSHFTRKNSWFRDADSILKWPTDTSWLNTQEGIHDTNIGLWQQLASYEGRDILLYNGSMLALPKHLLHKFRFLGLVEISDKEHKVNISRRKVANSPQPTDWDIIERNREELKSWAISAGVPVFGGFSSMASHLTHGLYKKVTEAYKRKHTILDVTHTALKLIAPDGVLRMWDAKPERLTFGAHVSMKIHTNEYARYTALTQHRWRHLTRHYPQLIVLHTIGYRPTIELTKCGNISRVLLNGEEISASGHMLGMMTWLGFPHSRVAGMPALYPDFHTYLSMYIANQKHSTPSLEPFNPEVAYHRWVETIAGLLGSYVAIKILLRRGLIMYRRDAILWKLYARRLMRSIVINDRTWYMNTKFNRDNDKRFGPLS